MDAVDDNFHGYSFSWKGRLILLSKIIFSSCIKAQQLKYQLSKMRIIKSNSYSFIRRVPAQHKLFVKMQVQET